ncbi:alpha/beta fold hydrolase [Rhodococcus sp. NPDC078407]|uniref:alpha/beta fold hydrolase n=1 Tax=Rhodococcus sp. NPDC078407 TaxID=3364509 RepID=UPI0037C60464
MTVGRVAVCGGDLVVETHTGTSEPIVVVHGVSSQRRLWGWLRAESPHLTLVAPDLRGRGDSVDVTGPSSLARHAADLDGGVPVAPPAGLTRESVAAVFADRIARTRQRFDAVEDYVDFLVSTSLPLLDRGDPLLRAYAEHDLVDGSVRLSSDAVVADAEDVFFGVSRFRELTMPIRLLHAQWSVGADSAPNVLTSGHRCSRPDIGHPADVSRPRLHDHDCGRCRRCGSKNRRRTAKRVTAQ